MCFARNTSPLYSDTSLDFHRGGSHYHPPGISITLDLEKEIDLNMITSTGRTPMLYFLVRGLLVLQFGMPTCTISNEICFSTRMHWQMTRWAEVDTARKDLEPLLVGDGGWVIFGGY